MNQSHENYSIRHFSEEDWSRYRDMRLEALQEEPSFFCTPYAQEAQRTDEEWQQFISNPRTAIFGLYHGDELIGITGIDALRDEPMTAKMFASYIREAHRGKGLSAMLYEARIHWARDRRFEKLVVSHRAGNVVSKAANQRHGFRYTHTEPRDWPDGTSEDNVFYALDL